MMRPVYYQSAAWCLVLLFLFSCAPAKPRYSKPIDELIRKSKSVSEAKARETIARYTGQSWVDNPKLDATISVYLRKDPRFVDHYYDDTVSIRIRDSFIGMGPLDTCLQVSVRPMEYVKDPRSDWQEMRVVRCKPKEICTRTIEEEESLLVSFFALRARYGPPRYR